MAAHYVYTKNQGNQEKKSCFYACLEFSKKKKKSKCYGVFIITYFHQKIINT